MSNDEIIVEVSREMGPRDPLSDSVRTEFGLRPPRVLLGSIVSEQFGKDRALSGRLDAEKRRDRLGHTTQTLYDAIRRPVMTRTPWARRRSTSTAPDARPAGRLATGSRSSSTRTETLLSGTTTARGASSRRLGPTVATELRVRDDVQPAEAEDRPEECHDYLHVLPRRQAAAEELLGRDALVSYTYSPVTGLMLTAANGTDTLTWTYDPMDRVGTEASTKNASTVGYSYERRRQSHVPDAERRDTRQLRLRPTKPSHRHHPRLEHDQLRLRPLHGAGRR